MAAVTICSDFGAQENKVCHCLHVLSICFAMKWWDWVPWSKFFECWVLSQLFHSLLSSSSRFSLVPLYFLPFSSVQSLSQVWFFTTPWITARQASLSITNSWSSLRLNVHRVSDAIQPFHPLSSPSRPAHSLSQHQSLFQWVNNFTSDGQSTGVSALASFLPKKSQGWSPSEWTGYRPS